MSQEDTSISIEEAVHTEKPKDGVKPNWKLSKSGDGDTALALFDNPDDLREPIDPKEMKKLIRRIDFMIIPYLAVCYAFFYIDKVNIHCSDFWQFYSFFQCLGFVGIMIVPLTCILPLS